MGSSARQATGIVTSRLSSPQLVGRDGELAQLVALANSSPALGVVEGDAGMGKTRLIEAVLSRPELADRLRLLGRCDPLREPFPLGPVVDALSAVRDLPRGEALSPVTGVLSSLIPELATLLPDPPPSLGDPRVDRHLLFRGIVELLDRLGPTVLVLEDLHWVDDGTAELLGHLVGRLPSGVSLLLSYRREDMPAGAPISSLLTRIGRIVSAVRLELLPLEVDQVRELAASILGLGTVPPEFARHLHERTAGVPFAVEEVLRLLPDPEKVLHGGRRAPHPLGPLTVPRSISDLVLDRIARLPPRTRGIIEAAAVAGVPADEPALAAMSRLSPAQTAVALREAINAAVLFELQPGRYGLRHALAAAAVYESLPQPERRRHHLRAAAHLEGCTPRPVALLAHHYSRAGRVSAWVECAEAAADLADSRQDGEASAGFLHEVLARVELPRSTRHRLAVKLGVAARSSSCYQREAVGTLQGAIQERGWNTLLLGKARSLLGLLLVENGDAVAGRGEQARALRELRGRPDLAMRVMINLAAPFSVDGDARQHLAWLERASRIAQQLEAPEDRLAAQLARATILMYLGDPAAWASVRQIRWGARTVDEDRELLWGASNLAGASFHLGHYRRARRFLEDTNRRAVRFGWDEPMQIPRAAELMLAWAAGDWHDLAARTRQAHDSIIDLPSLAALARFIEASLASAGGRWVEAEMWFRESLRLARDGGNIPGLALAAGGLTRLLLLQGRSSEALAEATPAIDLVAAKRIWVWAAEAVVPGVEAMLDLGRPESAEILVRSFSAGVRGRDAPLAQAALHACQALLAQGRGELSAARSLWAKAARAYGALPRPHEAAMASQREGLCRVGAGDRGAETPLANALKGFESLGATADAARLRRILRQHSFRVPHTWGTGRRGYGQALSPREQRVVQSVAEGLSNVAIAELLFLAPKTVENHVASAMRKLGVGSRTALAARWRGPTGPDEPPAT